MMGSVSASWTPERIAKLTEMKGRGCKAIWAALNALPGPALTKSAVIGKSDRMFGVRKPKLTDGEKLQRHKVRREKDAVRQKERRAARGATRREEKGFAGAAAFKVIHGIKGKQASLETPWTSSESASDDSGCLKIPFSELEAGDCKCRWPFAAPAETEGSFVYCGLHTPENSPYCVRHIRLSIQPPQQRRRSAA